MRHRMVGVVVAALLAASVVAGGEIGFPEDFALAKDRAEALKQLIPGTEDYYYYHCLHDQNEGRLDDVDRTLALWIKRYNRTQRVIEIENRQALLRYDANPAETRKSLDYIRHKLNVQFNHRRQIMGEKPKLPTRLDPKTIGRATLTQRALARHGGTLNGFEDRALDWAVTLKLDPNRRRHLLSRLRRPDYPNLVALVAADLNYEHSRGFGSHPIHGLMLRSQLDDLLRRKPDLLTNNNYVNTYLTKLRPAPDEDWQHDPKLRQAYLDRLWAFVSRLQPVHNSLKANVLYRRLAHDRGQGIYDKQRFMAYIKLPRNAPYIEPRWARDRDFQRYRANLQANYRQWTLLPPIGTDEPLVRSYLLHYFVAENSFAPYATFIDNTYLKHVLAEAKIVNGIGDMEQWYSMLPPATYQRLKERVDLDFAFTNKTAFGVDDAVVLDLHVKNVKTLIVKVFELNSLNYYRTTGREVHTGISLDGLVANEETVHTYHEPPLRRVKRTFQFPKLAGRGNYIIEFIGSGRSSRALIRKGRLQYLVRTSTAGHVFTLMDEANTHLKEASIWLAGHHYEPDKDGLVTVPYSTKPGRQPIILVHGRFATLERFDHRAEQYRLTAGIHVDREALVKRQKAHVLVRPALDIHGTPVTLSVLEEPTLVITSVDREGVSTTKEVADFKLQEGREAAYEFAVPAGLASIGFTLKAKIQNVTQAKKQDLAVTKRFSLNGIDRSDKVDDLHLGHSAAGYALDVLGKTGEPRANIPVNLTVKHRDFRDVVHVSLQSDANGRITLGALPDIALVTAKTPDGPVHQWSPARDRCTYGAALHGRVGDTLRLPYLGTAREPQRSELSLLERRGSTFVADRFSSLSVKDRFLEIGDLPAGDFDLLLKDGGQQIAVRVAPGQRERDYVLAAARHLQVINPKPLQIAAVSATDQVVQVRLANASKFARVHVAATRYLPEYPAYENLDAVVFPSPETVTVPKVESIYLEGRDIGEEYRYIIERKYAKKYAGVMLKRPSLLLNPWAVRSTETGTQEAKPGEALRRVTRGGYGGRATGAKRSRGGVARAIHFANLDYLGTPAAVLANLRPDENGVVTVQRADLGAGQQLHVVAVDPQNTLYREVALAEKPGAFEDLRLIAGLDPQKHFTEQKQVSVVAKGKQFVLPDITTSQFEAYDTLAKVYTLYATLSGNPTLIEFNFILQWPKLKPAEQREKYSKYACHELNLFLARKDPAFFEQVVQPYLRSKKDKTFMDHYLLGDDLRGYLKPWAFAQLNIVERVLLARRIEGEHPQMARHVKDLFDLIPPDIERFNHLFKTALKSSALETEDAFGLEAAADEAKSVKKLAALKQLTEGRRRYASRAGSKPATRAPGLAAPAEAPAATAPAPPPAAKAAPSRRKSRESLAKKDAKLADKIEAEMAEVDEEVADSAFFARDADRRANLRILYRKLDKTKEWAENNYYHLPIDRQKASLITVNAFWDDFARHDGKTPFHSVHVAEASRSFPEMLCALAVLDLPFVAAEHKAEAKGARFALDAASPMVVYHKEIKGAEAAKDKVPILVSQNFFRHNDRYRHVGNERVEKYVADEFLVHVVYGGHLVITNPTSARQKLDVLVQIPRGAIPVSNGHETRSLHIDLEPYRTQTLDYFFYFPKPGQFPHYPVHVAKHEKLVSAAEPFSFNVVEQLTKIDKTSWEWISQNGTEADVLAYLGRENIERTDLAKIAWRVQNPAFFDKVLPVLERRHKYHHTLWSYALKHNRLAALREYLQHCNSFLRRCGDYIDCKLVTIDPVVRKSYQHLEYWPLVNARAHRLGKRRQILNDRFYQQYMRLMKVLTYVPRLDDGDLMTTVVYLLTQDRVEEALETSARVDPAKLATRVQHDYCAAYLDFYTDKPTKARGIAARYAEHPVDRWRKLFTNVTAQLDEIEGKAVAVVDDKDRDQTQTQLAATEAAFDFKVEAKQITVNYQNLAQATVRYYLMDVELLFSRNPFVQQFSGQFSYIKPNLVQTIKLPEKTLVHTVALPEQFHSKNVLIELNAAGIRKAKAYYSNSLALQVIENYGQVRVTHAQTGKPLPKVYVKVYARMKDGRVRFYKDGYTDLRGRFDYASLSTNELDFVARFSLLVLSDAHGALVREAAPPKR